MDPFRGSLADPATLHKYHYGANNPVINVDPSGEVSLSTTVATLSVAVTISTISTLSLNLLTALTALTQPAVEIGRVDGWVFSTRVTANGFGGIVAGGFDAVYDNSRRDVFVALSGEFGSAPLSLFRNFRRLGGSVTVGPVFGMSSPGDLSGLGVSATFPISAVNTLPNAIFGGNKAWGMLTQLAQRTKTGRGIVAQFNVASSGPAALMLGVRNNSFTSTISFVGDFVRLRDLPSAIKKAIDPIAGSVVQSVVPLGNDAESLANNADAFLTAVRSLN